MKGFLVGTERGLYRVAGDGTAALIEAAGITALARSSGVRYALTDGRTVLSSGDGDTWKAVADVPLPGATCIGAGQCGVFVGIRAAHLLRVDDGRTSRVAGFETAEGRASWYTPWGGPPDIRSMAEDEGALLVNVHVGGILRSEDCGASWRPTIDVDADVHQVVAGPRPGLLLAATAGGLAVSEDAGATWEFRTGGLGAEYSRAVAVTGDSVFVSSSRGPGGGDSAVYRAAVGGGGFERCPTGLPEGYAPNIDSYCLSALGANVAFGTAEGALHVSADAGRTWSIVVTGLPAVTCVAVDS